MTDYIYIIFFLKECINSFLLFCKAFEIHEIWLVYQLFKCCYHDSPVCVTLHYPSVGLNKPLEREVWISSGNSLNPVLETLSLLIVRHITAGLPNEKLTALTFPDFICCVIVTDKPPVAPQFIHTARRRALKPSERTLPTVKRDIRREYCHNKLDDMKEYLQRRHKRNNSNE